ncbi:TetR/AcrR family transcriptional regulator [Sphingomonas sp. RT2P30]|uniref:TetR/AcrR family transcriptional regulator n=1 Tax=Parasphingomonas halimpatiens TaxID=3096162 RepID=UPI002FC6EF53
MALTNAAGAKPKARGRKSAGKRDAIMRAAVEVINERSYAQATMTEIAASLDLRDATLYYYFPSKQALAYACHVRSMELFERLLVEADRSSGTGLSKLTLFIRGMLEDAESNGPQLYFGDYSYLADDNRKHIGEWAARLTTMLEQFLIDGIAEGSVVPCEPHVVVQLLLGMLIWLAKWVPAIDGMTVDRLMSSIGVVSLDGLAAKCVPFTLKA